MLEMARVKFEYFRENHGVLQIKIPSKGKWWVQDGPPMVVDASVVLCVSGVVLCVTMRWSEDDEVTIEYTGVARHVISLGMLLQVLQWHIISPGRSCRFCKRHIISPKMYLLYGLLAEMMKTWQRARPTSSMKKGCVKIPKFPKILKFWKYK